MKTDDWMIHGLNGLNNLIQQRITSEMGGSCISHSNLEKLQAESQRLAKLTEQTTEGEPPENSGSSFDSWLWRGLNGLNNILQNRPIDQIELRIWNQLYREYGRLGELIKKLEV